MNSPAPITFFCVHCGTKLLVPVELAGETGPCPQCAAVITAPLVSTSPSHRAPIVGSQVALNEIPVAVAPALPPAAPVLPTSRLEAPRARHEFELPSLELPSVEPGPVDFGRPAGGVAGYNGGGLPEIPAVVRGTPASRRGVAAQRGDYPSDFGSSRFDEPAPTRPFPVALVSLLLVVTSGAGYLSWRMGFWGPQEDSFATGTPQMSSQVAKTEPVPVVTASASPVASLGGVTGALESSAVRTVESPAPEVTPTSPPGPQPLAALAAASSQSFVEVPPPISEPRLAVVPPEPTKPKIPAEPMPQTKSMRDLDPGAASEGTALERARKVIRAFLEAGSWKDRVGLVEVSGDPFSVLSAYYQKNPDLPIQNYRLDFFHEEEGGDGAASAFIFFLTFANDVDGFPVMVLKRREDYRIDWDLYVEFRGRAFQRFVEEMPSDAMRFRVVLQRVTYGEPDREDIPGVDQLLCYKIDPPYPGVTRYAFVEKEKPIGKQMARELSWESDPLAAEVQLRWAEFPGGKRYLTIEQLVSSSWVRPVGPNVAQP